MDFRRVGILPPMMVQTLKGMLARRPFQPVRLVVSGGQSYEIRQAEMAFLTRTSILVGIDAAAVDGVPAEFKIVVSLPHMTAIEPIGTSTAA